MLTALIFIYLALLWFGLYLYPSFTKKNLKYIFFLLIFIVFLYEVWLVYSQYKIWASSELTKFFLPPYKGFDYLFFYSFKRIFGAHLVSLGVSLIFLFLIKYLNRLYDYRFFNDEEPLLAATAIFSVGYPALIPYILAVLSLQFLMTLNFSFYDSKARVSLYPLWVPLALFVILITNHLSTTNWWQLLKI